MVCNFYNIKQQNLNKNFSSKDVVYQPECFSSKEILTSSKPGQGSIMGKGEEGSTSFAGADPSWEGKNHSSGLGLQLSSSNLSKIEQQT
jgi:hypothetical protein